MLRYSNQAAESQSFNYQRMHVTEIRVARNFVVQALRGEPLTLYGDGSQTRSFCYVDDLLEGLIRLMNGNHTGPINLGNPGESLSASWRT